MGKREEGEVFEVDGGIVGKEGAPGPGELLFAVLGDTSQNYFVSGFVLIFGGEGDVYKFVSIAEDAQLGEGGDKRKFSAV